MKTAEEFIHEFQDKFRENGGGVVKQLMQEYAKQLLEEYTNRIVENVKMNVQPSEMEAWEVVPTEITRKDVDDEEAGCEDFWISIDKKSITQQLEIFKKEIL